MKDELIKAYTRKLKIMFEMAEEKFPTVEELAPKIIQEFNLEYLTDIKNNAGTVSKITTSELENDPNNLYHKLYQLQGFVYRKTLNEVSFMVMSQDIYDKYEAYILRSVKNIICLNDWDSSTILMGYRGEQIEDASYWVTPYVPFASTPAILGKDDFIPRFGILTRYGKQLIKDGAKNYARLEIVNE
jgi:hypothetical protein